MLQFYSAHTRAATAFMWIPTFLYYLWVASLLSLVNEDTLSGEMSCDKFEANAHIRIRGRVWFFCIGTIMISPHCPFRSTVSRYCSSAQRPVSRPNPLCHVRIWGNMLEWTIFTQQGHHLKWRLDGLANKGRLFVGRRISTWRRTDRNEMLLLTNC